jgi:murein DD-endopeptidase MepM/ murein hydrolase activator NlpD
MSSYITLLAANLQLLCTQIETWATRAQIGRALGQSARCAAATAAAAGIAVLGPATRLHPDPQIVEVLPAEVRVDVVKLSASVAELEARTSEMAKQVKPGPDALDRVVGDEAKAVARLRQAPAPVPDPGNIREGLAGVKQRLDTLNDSLRVMKTAIDTRRVLVGAMPLVRPVNGVISSPYGKRKSPINGKRSQHEGVDIAAPKGSVIVAPADGVVTTASGNHQGYGRVIMLDHGYGVTTVFAHLGRIDIKAGAHVKRGQPIALIGVSGETTGPHLHYEVRLEDQPVDPTPFLTFDLARVQALAAPGA